MQDQEAHYTQTPNHSPAGEEEEGEEINSLNALLHE